MLGVAAPWRARGAARRDLRARSTYVPQEIALDPEMTGRECLRLLATLYGFTGDERRRRLAETAERFGIAAHLDRRVQALSGGLRRRLHVAAGVLHDPDLLLLDEPTAGLDAEASAALWADLARRAREGAAVAMVTHDLAAAERHADAVLMLEAGEVVAEGRPSDLVATIDAAPAPDGSALAEVFRRRTGRDLDAPHSPNGRGRRWSEKSMSAAAAVAWEVCRRTWTKTLRRPVVLTFSLGQPLIWMLLFGFLFQRFQVATEGGGTYLDFLAPGVAAMTVLFGASQSGVGWIRDLQTGFLPRWLQTPASPHHLLLGKLAADVGRLLVQAAVVLALGLLLGARLHPRWPALPAAVLCLALFAAAMSGVSTALALRARAPEPLATFVHLVNMPLLFTSTALVPHRQMPDWLATVARCNPLTLAVDAWRGALLGAPAFDVIRSLLPLLLIAALAYAVAARELRRASALY